MLDDPALCPAETTNILIKLQGIAPVGNQNNPKPSNQNGQEGERGHLESFWIRFVPELTLLTMGSNPILLLDELKDLGETCIVAHTSRIPELSKITPDHCYTFWDIILTTDKGMDAIRDVFIFVEDDCDLTIELIDELGRIGNNESQLLAELFISEAEMPYAAFKEKFFMTIDNLELNQEIIIEPNEETKNSSQENGLENGSNRGPMKSASVSNIRVASEKLDNLVDLVGELVIVQERLNEYASHQIGSELLLIAEETNRLISELRDVAMEMRLLPIGTTFSKFKRLVRDLAHEQGKDIVLTTEGGDTELDKTVLEHLNDPLVHIIRNSIDHGIEPSSVRMFSGKSNQSHIHLSASHSGSDVVIKIKDDGRGLDTEAILKKAIDQGLVHSDAELTTKEIHTLIFQPGFSTANKVSSLSGRGVGMDVVKRNIEELRGSVSISSKKNTGTTITLRLPITLGIIEGLLVRIGQSYFVLPLAAVEECVDIHRKGQSNGRCIANVRGQIVPYIKLREQFDIVDNPPEIEHILIAKINDNKIGFLVDEVIGEHQIVIKSLGKMYRHVEGLSGATILGDGTVALILDVKHLVEMAENNETIK